MKAAVVGGGFIGNAHVEALRRLGDVEVAALCDEYNVREKAEELHIPYSCTDFRQMLDEVKPDTVHICTPNHTHYSIARYAIEKGVHVVCEKPFTSTTEEARELTELAEKNKVKGMVDFHNRFYPVPLQMKDMVSKGKLGKTISVHGAYIQDWLLFDTDYSWRLDAKKGGRLRAVADIGSHWLDLVQYITGQQITRVNAKFSTVYPIRKRSIKGKETFQKAGAEEKYEDVKIETEDIAVVMMEFENGAVGSMIVSQMFAGKKNTTEIAVAGTKSSLCWSTEELSELYIGHRDGPNEILTKDPSLMCSMAASAIGFPGGHAEGFPDAVKHAFRQFYDSVAKEGNYEYATFRDGLKEMVLCDAIYESARTEQWMKV